MEVAKEEIKKEQSKDAPEEIKEDKKEEAKEKKEPSPLFVSDDDLFNVSVKYYRDYKKLKIEDEEDFNPTHEDIQELTCTLKYPSQGDTSLIAAQSSQVKKSGGGATEELSLRDFIQLEFIRFAVLVREWNLDETLNNNNIMKLHPKVVKAVLNKVREEIDMDGIF